MRRRRIGLRHFADRAAAGPTALVAVLRLLGEAALAGLAAFAAALLAAGLAALLCLPRLAEGLTPHQFFGAALVVAAVVVAQMRASGDSSKS